MSEILNRLLDEGKLRRHRTSPQEIADLFNLAQRDIADASVKDVSADRRFATAYEAALNLATITLHSKGYETHGYGHHLNTFEALRESMARRGRLLRTTSMSVARSEELLSMTEQAPFQSRKSGSC